MNYIDVKYPLFSTTDKEKYILQQCELHIIKNSHQLLTLETVLYGFENVFNSTYTETLIALRNKIKLALDRHVSIYGYILFNNDIEPFLMLEDYDVLTRIWITHLLNISTIVYMSE